MGQLFQFLCGRCLRDFFGFYHFSLLCLSIDFSDESVEGVDYSSSFNGTHHTLNIKYEHSSHTIEVVGNFVISDFAGWLFLPFSILSAVLALATNKRLKKQQKHV